MNSKSKLEKVLELVINEDTDRASDLLHDIFVEKSREIYADLIEEDASVEDVIEEDEDELEEAIDDSDMEDDFIEDIEDSEEEIEAEETFGEADEEDEAEAELADELAGDEEAEEEGDAESEAEEAMMNVEDALAELKAAFADLVGDDAGEEEGDEMEMEMPEMESVEEFAEEVEEVDEAEELEEGAEMKAVNVSMPNGEDSGAKSPVKDAGNDMGNPHPTDTSEEAGGKAEAPKAMGVDGPQEAGEPRAVKG